jgi:hypothetical protein
MWSFNLVISKPVLGIGPKGGLVGSLKLIETINNVFGSLSLPLEGKSALW